MPSSGPVSMTSNVIPACWNWVMRGATMALILAEDELVRWP
jgi:hypothetical protein